uniref:RHS repeat domain-containing protein n=1 Tax=Gynuella sp. TaxID=2969146 RepID=UPI003D0B6BA4
LGEQVIAMRVSGNRLYYVHNDHLNTPRILTDQNQAKVWEVQTTPFGEVSEEITTGITNLKGFPGQMRDPETGYSDNWHRTYDPSIGRYLQSDPIGLNGGLNTYGYVNGNPINFYDPNGLIACAASGNWAAACAAAAAAAEAAGSAVAGAATSAAVFVGGMLIPSGMSDGTLAGNGVTPPYFNSSDDDDELVPHFPGLPSRVDPSEWQCMAEQPTSPLPTPPEDPREKCFNGAKFMYAQCLATSSSSASCYAALLARIAICSLHSPGGGDQ